MSYTENESDRLFREKAEALALVIAKGRWRCNGTMYRDEYLDGAERLGIPENKATATIGIKLAIEFIESRKHGLICLEDMEVATKKARKRGWIEAHAFLIRLAMARYRRNLDAAVDEQRHMEQQLAIARHEATSDPGEMILRMMNDFTATAEQLADEEIARERGDA